MLIINADRLDTESYYACCEEDLNDFLIDNGFMYVKSEEIESLDSSILINCYIYVRCKKLDKKLKQWLKINSDRKDDENGE